MAPAIGLTQRASGTTQRRTRTGQPLLASAKMLTTLARQSKMAYYWPFQRAPPNRQHHSKITHPDNNSILPLKLGNVSIASGHLGTVQGPKTAHHFDGALRRVGHLPRFKNGNSPIKNKVDPGSQEGPWGRKGRPSPYIPISGSVKGDNLSCIQ